MFCKLSPLLSLICLTLACTSPALVVAEDIDYKITATIIAPEELEGSDIEYRYSYSLIRGHEPRLKLPHNFNDLSYEEQNQALNNAREQFQKDAREWSRNLSVLSTGTFDAEGLLEIALKEPGEFFLRVLAASAATLSSSNNATTRHALAAGGLSFTITPQQAQQTSIPIDLGQIQLHVTDYGLKQIHRDAPDFRATTLDGQEISLADMRGKFVLIDFWATWCGPCVAETPHLKKVYEQFGSDPRFVMIGVSFDRDETALKKYIEENDLRWHHVHISSSQQRADIYQSWRFRGIPEIVLIGPDGKRISSSIRGEQILQEVSAALAAPAET